MAFETEEDIYRHLYDPNIEDSTKYSRETLCIWIRATIHSAINQGVILGTNRENKRVSDIIAGTRQLNRYAIGRKLK